MKNLIFAWHEENISHIERHSVSADEAEYVVRHSERPYPEKLREGKYLVWGPTANGRFLQVIFVVKTAEEIGFESLNIEDWDDVSEDDEIGYVIHAMPLTESMKRNYHRRRRNR